MKLAIILSAVIMTGCSSMNYSSGWEHGGKLLAQGPNWTKPGQEANYNGPGPAYSTAQVMMPNGSYTVSRSGSTYSVIQTSKTR